MTGDGCTEWCSALSRDVRPNGGAGTLPRIFCFPNGGSDDWWTMTALSEDGEFLAGHLCSHPTFGPHDMGITSDWKHEHYSARYPDGFRIVWYPGNPTKNDDELARAIRTAHAKHLEAGRALRHERLSGKEESDDG